MQLTFNINEDRLAHFLTNVRSYLGLNSLKLSQVQVVDMEVRPVLDMITFDVYYTRLTNDLLAETQAEQEKIWEEEVCLRFEHILQLDSESGRPIMSFRVKQTNGEDELRVIDRREYTPPAVELPRVDLTEFQADAPAVSVEDKLIKLYGDQPVDEGSGLVLPPNMK